MQHQPTESEATPAAVLTKALLRAKTLLGMSQSDLAAIIGLSSATVSRLENEGRTLEPTDKAGELGLLFLRVFRSLDTLVGGQPEKAREWLAAYNAHLGGVPGELIQRVEGLVRVAEYLDAMRGKA